MGGCASTTLHSACQEGNVDAARLLLERKADVHKATNRNRTPLHGICNVLRCQDCHIEVARLLLANGADVDRKDGGGKTPMAIAESRKHRDIVALLVEHKAGLQTAPAAAAEAPAPAAPGLEPCL